MVLHEQRGWGALLVFVVFLVTTALVVRILSSGGTSSGLARPAACRPRPNRTGCCAAVVDQTVVTQAPSCDGMCKTVQDHVLAQRKGSTWNWYYNDVSKFIATTEPSQSWKQLVIVEVGTAFGGMANNLLTKLPCSRLYAVDPFMVGYDKDDSQSALYEKWMAEWKLDAQGFSTNWASAMVHNMVVTQGHGCRYSLLHKKSLDAVASFPDQSIDIIFIDGLHTYDGVRDDIAAWRPKMRCGAVMLFNDYVKHGGGRFPGVSKAVEEWAAANAETIGCCINDNNAYIKLKVEAH